MKRELDIIKISIELAGGHIIEGRLDNVAPSSHLISVAVLAASPEFPTPGTNLDLYFEIPGEDPRVQVLAVAKNVRQENGKFFLALEVIDWHEFHRHLPSNISTSFNRRSHFRVSMPRQNETEVSVVSMQSGSSVSATMLDISLKGSKLCFASEGAPGVGETLRIKFCLPNSDYQLDLLANVTGVWKTRNAWNCGAEFKDDSPDDDKPFLAQQKQISQYIMERQRELARMGINAGTEA
ncbi:MAG: PilZ domain-containing protein [Gammaproteobacteria bacterium]|nr:PilZ domain-containing protein [Gammaproteobacteria bacterium]